MPLEKLSRLSAKALEKILQADPDCAALTTDLQGTLKLTFTEWAVSVVFVPEIDGVPHLKIFGFSDYEGIPTVSVTGRVADFLGLLARESASVVKSQVTIEGDVRVLAKYQAFFKRWKIDFGHVLSSVLGEGPARFLYGPLKKGADFLRYQRQERMQDLKEVFYEEKKLLVPQAELEEFYSDLKALQLRVDRLIAKVNS